MKQFLSHYRFRLLLNSVLLVLLVLSIPSPPLLLELSSLLLLVLAGINTVRSHNRWFHLICAMGTLSLFMTFVPPSWHIHPFLKRGIPQITFLLLLVVSIFHRVTQQRPVTRELLYGLCALYLNFVLAFALTYNLIERLSPHSFVSANGPLDMASFVYFSMITLTTIGYGDIVPVHPLPRLLAGSEAIMGALFIALAVARGLSLMSDDSKD
ncbi:potassium channel family protein [Pseudomonas nicosulfuronedens]|nr:potassium channel family protein [Pseudomonas nicosulfuronedens]MDH1007531.1 potassium channel family protein [Pseudomonas nicosulfuronedens]MDH1977577.1 potassium channel family protein [Pseudomonas nicosulfuronedens]MDH2025824.1 potassium channel family protein [Pseudomonas nicosulfuronedens]